MTAHSTVTIHMAACPDCGRLYVSGGTTRTTYSRKPAVDTGSAKGTYVDTEI